MENVPEGVHINFLRAERSLHRWAHDDISRISEAERLASAEGAGVEMHLLEDSGHWVCIHGYVDASTFISFISSLVTFLFSGMQSIVFFSIHSWPLN